MNTAMAALSITTNIVTSIVTVPGFGFTADSIEGGHDLYQRARSLLDQIAGSCDAQTCDHLTNSISAELDAIEGQLVESGYDRSHIDSFIDHLETSVKQTITLLADDENALREAILKPEVFRYYVLAQSASARQNYTPGDYHVLGADGFGFSDTRRAARRWYHIDAESMVVRTLAALADKGQVDPSVVQQAIDKYELFNCAIQGNDHAGEE